MGKSVKTGNNAFPLMDPARVKLVFVLIVFFGLADAVQAQQTAAPVLLPGTRLRVTLPEGWRIDPPRNPGQLNTLTRISRPRYDLSVSQTNAQSVGYSCMDFIGSIQSIAALKATIRPRLSFVPDIYLGSMLDITIAQMVCLATGDAEVVVTIQPVDGASNPAVITPMLAAIADAAVKQSGAVTGPGRIRLPTLGVEIPIRNATWGFRTVTGVWGRMDVLSRQARSRANELHISLLIFPLPGRCEELGRTSPFGTSSATFVSGRRYGGDKWVAGAWEQQPPPFKALQAFVCRNVGTNSILLARIDYEKTAITDDDRNVIRQILDDVGDAVDSKLATPASSPVPANPFVIEPQVLSDLQNFEVAGYLSVAISRIRDNWFAVIPEAALNGGKGRVDITFAIARDGSVQDQRVLVSSRNNDLDNGALSAIQLSTPFASLPPEFKGERLALKFTFFYNVTPDSPR